MSMGRRPPYASTSWYTTPSLAPDARSSFTTRRNREGNPRSDHDKAVYCKKTQRPLHAPARCRSSCSPAFHPCSFHVTRTSSSAKPRSRNAPPRYRQYSSIASVGSSLRPSSATICRWFILARSFLDEETADHQRVHAGAEKGSHRIGGRVYDCFASQVERRVHHDWDAGAFFKLIDQPPVERIYFFLHRLRPRASIHVRYRRNHAAFLRPHLRRQYHEGRVGHLFHEIGRRFLFHGRRERPPPFAEFHRVVYLRSHLRIARIGQNGAVSQCPGTKLHASLKPA